MSRKPDSAIDTAPSADAMAAIQNYPAPVRARLLELRRLVVQAAAETPRVGPLIETLKWGQPSFLPEKPRVGSTVRLGTMKGDQGRCAMFFHCQTRLVETFRHLCPDTFIFEGNRAMLIPSDKPIPADAIRHCASLALTYHLWK
jgi:hypothetical protein